jgi:thymidylate synthase (FAD)
MLMNSRNNRRRLMTNQIIVQLNPDVPPTGSDLGIVNAARKSFGRRSKWNWSKELESGTGDGRTLKDKDKRLLEFLARGMTADDFDEFKHTILASKLDDMSSDFYLKNLTEHMWEFRNTPTHDTPFNHGFFSFEVKAPVFVARHLVKHEYLIMSEYSRRYITDDVEFYTPDVWRKAAEDVKQGSSDEGVAKLPKAGRYGEFDYEDICGLSLALYEQYIEAGVAPEQARMVLPQSLMTSWTWSGTLGAFANLCKLRLSKDTQYETRLVAQGVYAELKKQFPVAAPLLVEGVI